MSTYDHPRRRQFLTAALAACTVVAAGPASSQAPAPSASPPRTPAEFAVGVGWVSAVLPLGGQPGVSLAADFSAPGRGRTRPLLGVAYAREVNSSSRCCGPNPGYTYQEGALSVSLGQEVRLISTGAARVWADARYHPTWAHTIRRGSQEDFVPPPTQWQFSGTIASLGLAARWPVSGRLRATANLRYQADLGEAVVRGGFPSAVRLGVSLGR